MAKYKTVTLGRLSGKDTDTPDSIISPVAKVIENEAAGGWTFVNLYDMPIYFERTGCLAKFSNQGGFTSYYYMLVFKKED